MGYSPETKEKKEVFLPANRPDFLAFKTSKNQDVLIF